jgi:hypothetical protein
VLGEPDRARLQRPRGASHKLAQVAGLGVPTVQDPADHLVGYQDLAGEGMAHPLLRDAPGVIIQVVEGAEHLVVAAHQEVAELVDQADELAAAAGRGRVGDVGGGWGKNTPSQARSSELGTMLSGVTRIPQPSRKVRGAAASAARSRSPSMAAS